MTEGARVQRNIDHSRDPLTPARASELVLAITGAPKSTPSPEEVVTSALALLERETQIWLQARDVRAETPKSDSNRAKSDSL